MNKYNQPKTYDCEYTKELVSLCYTQAHHLNTAHQVSLEEDPRVEPFGRVTSRKRPTRRGHQRGTHSDPNGGPLSKLFPTVVDIKSSTVQ